MLPRLDGLEVLRQLRRTAATPVLMLTARDDEADKVAGLEVGADDYLTKPFTMGELIARVRALFRRSELMRQMLSADRDGAAETLIRGRSALDPESPSGDAGRRDARPQPDGVRPPLHLLLKSPGRAFSRAYLLETIWQEAYIGGDRSVDNVVLRLRKKLGAMGDEIETVWAVGYRLRPEERR